MKGDDVILMAHGGGGELMMELIDAEILSRFKSPALATLADSAVIDAGGAKRLAFTTDSYVVQPLFFPGGDIGRLAVCGTVNDLAAVGARPIAMSLSLILEEGLKVGDLRRALDGAASAALEASVEILTGDTKVVERGKADGMFITTSGIGIVETAEALAAGRIRPGDAIILSGTIGDHGIAVLSKREGLGFEAKVKSDTAPLWTLAKTLIARASNLRAMKDPTRGGLAAALNELAAAADTQFVIDESAVPVHPAVAGACEALGLDVFTVANEGKLIAIVPAGEAVAALRALKAEKLGKDAAIIGEVRKATKGAPPVVLKTTVGGERVLDMPYGEDLPRIC